MCHVTGGGVHSFADLLRTSKADLTPGLDEAEFGRIEERFDVAFSALHRAFLGEVLPLGRGWPDWRSGDPDGLREGLSAPIEGVLFDVEWNGFWALGWGERPTDGRSAVAAARERLEHVPAMVPVYGHRFSPAARSDLGGHPVLSIVQTDVIYYGRDIARYLAVEFAGIPVQLPRTTPAGAWTWPDSRVARGIEVEAILREPREYYVPFWSELAEDRIEDL
jgi:hypothetical protein